MVETIENNLKTRLEFQDFSDCQTRDAELIWNARS